jgi:hypothetical protein
MQHRHGILARPGRFIPGRAAWASRRPTPGSYGGAVDGDHAQVLLVDLGGVLFSFDHEYRLTVLGECLGLPPGRVDELLWQSGFSADCDAGRYRDAAAIARRSAASLAMAALISILMLPGAARSGRTDPLGAAVAAARLVGPAVFRD